MSEEVIRSANEQFLPFKDKSDEESVRNGLVKIFDKNYNEFFYPENTSELEKSGEKILTSLDFQSGDRGVLSVVFDDSGSKLVLPYLDLNERFMQVFKRDLDPSFINGIRRNESRKIPNLEGLSDKMSWYLEKEVFIYSFSYILAPYNNGVQRLVERLDVAKDIGQNPIGEIWLGSKWKPGNTNFSEDASKAVELLRAA